jgi:4-hydroxy-tetrahydrodipicolinate synthase
MLLAMTTLLTAEARGVFAIAPTPFTDDGALDLASADALADFYLEREVDGITLLGVMGEAPKLDLDESLDFTRRVIDRVAGAVPVVIGVSNPGLQPLARLAREAMHLGAAGVMVSPMAGLRTEEQVVAYAATVCRALGPEVPVCLQDYPPSSGLWMSVATLARIIDGNPQIVMLKHEDHPGLAKLTRVREMLATRRRVSVLVGNGGLHLPQELARGADGVMTGFAFPEMLVGVYRRFVAGDVDGAEDLFDAYLPLVRHEFQPGFGLAIRKEILRRRGVLKSAAVRQPGPALDARDLAELDRLLARLDGRRLLTWGPRHGPQTPNARPAPAKP